MQALEKRLDALEAAVPTKSPPRVIFIVALGDDWEPWSAKADQVDGDRIDRLPDESVKAFYSRVEEIVSMRMTPGQRIPLVFCSGKSEDQL